MYADEEARVVRCKPVAIPERLCEGPMGLGVDAAPVDGQARIATKCSQTVQVCCMYIMHVYYIYLRSLYVYADICI